MSDWAAEVRRLTSEFESLSTFEAASDWDHRCSSVVALIEEELSRVQRTALEVEEVHAQAVRAHAGRPFLARLFGSKAAIREAAGRRNAVQADVERLSGVIDDLLQRIDFTPNSAKDRTAILKELRAEKKEVQLAKKELAAEKRAINSAARQASARAGGVIFYSSKMAAAERRAIRRQKERMIGPIESQSAAIERQLRAIERRILWIERFGTTESE